MSTKLSSKFKGLALNEDFNMKMMHDEMQRLRNNRKDVRLKDFLKEAWGDEMTPQRFYRELGIDMKGMTVEKMLQTSELNRWLFPEVFRDAIIRGLEYTPFYSNLVTGEETIESTGLTMPMMDFSQADQSELQLRDVNEGATIPEGEIIAWAEKQVSIKKKARGLKQTYESIMFTPIDLAAIYFEELGTRLGADLDADLVDIAFNGDQADGSEASPVIGAETAGVLAYTDLTRAWVRFRKLGRTSSVILASEEDANTLLNMEQFQNTVPAGAQTPSGIELNMANPLPSSQDIFVHELIPTGKLVMVDRARAFVQLTAMPLLVESERIVSRQLTGDYVSIITGFANVFNDGRMVLDYTTDLTTNPGPQPPQIFS